MFENVDNIHTCIRTTEAYLYYTLTNERKGSGELKMVIKSRTSFYEYPFNNTAHYHVLKRCNFSYLIEVIFVYCFNLYYIASITHVDFVHS